MLPSLTVLHVVLFSFLASFSFATGVPELDDTYTKSSHVTALSDIVLDNPTITGAYCDICNGTITINVVGGLDPDYEYSIDGGLNYFDSNFFENLCIGDYLIIIRRKTDQNCSAITTGQIPVGPDLSINGFSFVCQEGVNGADFIASIEGGTAEYTLSYELPDGTTYSTTSFPGEIPFEIAEIVEGNYTFTISDRLGCVKDTTFFVEECCTFRYDCINPPLVLQCMAELPAIDSVYLDGITTGSSDLDSLQSQDILTITANCYDGIVSAVDITTNTPTDCVNDTLKIARTYTIDQNGTPYTCVQEYHVLTFQDALLTETAEELNIECASDGTLQSAIDTWLSMNGGAEVSSCGSNPVWVNDYVLDSHAECGGTGSVLVLFTFTDDCGTLLTTEASINIYDTIAPQISSCENLVMDCGLDLTQIDAWLANNGGMTATDECSELMITHNFVAFTPDCEDSGENDVIFTVTDECDNTSTCIASIIVADPNAYQVLCPSDLEVDLEDPNLLATINGWLQLANTEDPCLPVDYPVTNDFDPADLDVECDYLSIAVTFSATNSCGVEKFCTAQIVAAQDIGGTVNCPDPLVIECGDPDNENIIQNWLDGASAEDFEGTDIPLTNNYSTVGLDCGDTPIFFSGEDNCGQDVNCASMIIVEDTTPPIIECPAELNLSCGEDIAAINDWLASISATDNCGVGIITNDFQDAEFTLTCGESGHYDVTFTATDVCGVSSECVGRINVFDDSNIGIVCPDNLILDEGVTDIDAAVQAWIATASVNDPCDLGLQITNNFGPSTITTDCGFIMGEVTFEITSTCGPIASCTATISGSIDVTPTINCPMDLTLACGESTNDATIAAWVSGATAEDFAGAEIPLSNNLPTDLGSVCGVIEVIFSATDDCDNELTCVQMITIEDNEAPVIVCADERTVDLSAGSAQPQINEILENIGVLDNCSEDVSLEYSFDANLDDLGCGDVEMMTLTATDACGNVAVCETEIRFIDYNDIYIDCPDPLSVSCLEEDLEAYIYDYLQSVNVQSSRLETEVTMNYDPSLVDDACNDYISFEVEIIATDACGTQESCIVPVEILPEMKVFVPNIFNPDGDGINDMVTVYANKNVVMVKEWLIFDRWGEVVHRGYDFEPNSDQDGWDGMFKGRAADQNVYTFMLTVQDDFGRESASTGTITLMK